MSLATLFGASALAVFSHFGAVNAVLNREGLVTSTYFAGYHARKGFGLEMLPWSKFTDVKYAFAETTPEGCFDLSKSNPDLIPEFVRKGKQEGVKVQVSLGGWAGSQYFSTAVGSPENRTAFVKQCIDLVKKYDLDGLDIDWEYPNNQGYGCNTINVNDTSNFLAFLKELRQHPDGKSLFLTAAGSILPWKNNQNVTSTGPQLNAFAEYLDYIMIMGYDVFGAWLSVAGPNAPLDQSCDKRNNQGGVKQAVAAWNANGTGIPLPQIVIGLAAYGHSFAVNRSSALSPGNTLNLYPAANSSNRLRGSVWDDDAAIDKCGNPSPPSGTWPFSKMITDAHLLDDKGLPEKGMIYGYDSCSETANIYNNKTEVYVNYDDTRSFEAKGAYIRANNLAGFSIFEAGGDYNHLLVNAARKGMDLHDQQKPEPKKQH